MLLLLVTTWVEIKCKSGNDIRLSNNEENAVQENSNKLHNNIILKNKIIKLSESSFNLRSLSVEAELNFLMAGESYFYIFSRGREEFSTDMSVCYINKELDSNRKFINFAILQLSEDDGVSYIIKTLKKQEIPKQENYINNLDICEVRLSFIDNGDNKCYVLIENDSKKQLVFMADFYLPTSECSNLMFGGNL